MLNARTEGFLSGYRKVLDANRSERRQVLDAKYLLWILHNKKDRNNDLKHNKRKFLKIVFSIWSVVICYEEIDSQKEDEKCWLSTEKKKKNTKVEKMFKKCLKFKLFNNFFN